MVQYRNKIKGKQRIITVRKMTIQQQQKLVNLEREEIREKKEKQKEGSRGRITKEVSAREDKRRKERREK